MATFGTGGPGRPSAVLLDWSGSDGAPRPDSANGSCSAASNRAGSANVADMVTKRTTARATLAATTALPLLRRADWLAATWGEWVGPGDVCQAPPPDLASPGPVARSRSPARRRTVDRCFNRDLPFGTSRSKVAASRLLTNPRTWFRRPCPEWNGRPVDTSEEIRSRRLISSLPAAEMRRILP
jgi:hypothetical protein